MATAVDAHTWLMMTLQKWVRLKPIKPEAKPVSLNVYNLVASQLPQATQLLGVSGG